MNWLEEMPSEDTVGVAPATSVNGATSAPVPAGAPAGTPAAPSAVDLVQRREELAHRVAELQWDLGGLVYEMAIRDHIRLDVIVRRAAVLQEVDAELAEVDRILKHEQSGTAGSCGNCGSAAQPRRRLLLAVRAAARRSGAERHDRPAVANDSPTANDSPAPARRPAAASRSGRARSRWCGCRRVG